jgi:hypothetical protein
MRCARLSTQRYSSCRPPRSSPFGTRARDQGTGLESENVPRTKAVTCEDCWLILEVRSQIVYFWSIFPSLRVPICTLAQGFRLLLCWSRILLQNRRRYVGKLLATAIFISLPSEGIECRSTSELWNCFCRQIRHPAQENPGSKDCPERSCCATSKGWAATSSNAICSCVAE